MQLVGVIADTHGVLNPLAYAALADCGHIIHAGDICDTRILGELETLAPVSAVLGNNDFAQDYPSSVQKFAKPVIDGVRFLVGHYPQSVRITYAGSSAVAPGDPLPQVCIHGHTHLPRLDFGKDAYPAQYVVNPGSATRPRGGYPASIAKIAVEGGKVLGIAIQTFDGKTIKGVGDQSLF